MTDTFTAPAEPGAELPLADLLGRLLLITVDKETDIIETKFGPTTAIACSVAVLDGSAKGDTYDDILIFPRVLKSQLKKSVGGGKVLGRLAQGENKKGNPPWKLDDPTDDDKDVARKYLAYVAEQAVESEPF